MAVDRDELAEPRSLVLPRDTPPGQFGPLAGFARIWRAKWRGDRLPGWSDFDFYDFAGWHGFVYVDEVVARDPLDLRCRLWGTKLTDLLGSDETGRLFSQSPAAAAPGRLQANTRLVREGLIGLSVGRALNWGRQIRFTVLKLPCAEDGVTVDHILGCARPEWPGDPAFKMPDSAPPESAA